MKLKNIIQSGCLAMVMAASSTSFAQSSISNYGGYVGFGYYVIVRQSYIMGQTFRVGPDNILNDFTVWTAQYQNAVPGNAVAKIYQWDETNNTVLGSSLFTSGPYSIGSTTTYTATTVTTSNLSLVTGTDYILFFEADAQSAGTLFGASYDVLPNSRVTTQIDQPSIYDPWNHQGSKTLAFTANFSPSNPGSNVAPEPGTLGLALTGGCALFGLYIRRRKAV